jgi:hypothetical protein
VVEVRYRRTTEADTLRIGLDRAPIVRLEPTFAANILISPGLE